MFQDVVIINITHNANPPPTIMDRVDRMPIRDKDTRVTIGAAPIVFHSLNVSDAPGYNIQVIKETGAQRTSFVLCEFD